MFVMFERKRTYHGTGCNDVDEREHWVEQNNKTDDQSLKDCRPSLEQFVEVSIPQRRQLFLATGMRYKLHQTTRIVAVSLTLFAVAFKQLDILLVYQIAESPCLRFTFWYDCGSNEKPDNNRNRWI